MIGFRPAWGPMLTVCGDVAGLSTIDFGCGGGKSRPLPDGRGSDWGPRDRSRDGQGAVFSS